MDTHVSLLSSICFTVDLISNKELSHSPLDFFSILNLIKCYRKDRDILKVRRIHADVLKNNLIAENAHIVSALIATYADFGRLEEAREVFDQLPVHDVVCWSSLIAGYTQNGLGNEALQCYRRMRDAEVRPNPLTYVFALKACGNSRSLEMGKHIDAEVRKQGLLQRDAMLGNALVDMYFKCGALEKAHQVFLELPVRDHVSWNTLLTGYVQNGLGNEVLEYFRQMQNAGVCPDAVTYVCILEGCGILGSLDIGETIDARIQSQRLLEKDVVLGTALVNMYSKCGALEKAREVFELLPERNVVSWSALIDGYARQGLSDEAFKCFSLMKAAGVQPNAVTYINILKVCAMEGYLDIGEHIHCEVQNLGLLENVMLGTAVVDMYSKCDALEKAMEVFQQLPSRNIVTWNALISGYVCHGLCGEVLDLFTKMKNAGVCPDEVTYVCVLKACSTIGSLEIGEKIYFEIRNKGFLHKNVVLGTALVDMYTKCGAVEKAQRVFNELPERNVVSWSALIAGYVQHGLGDEALNCFMMMQNVGICPEAVTYISTLKACGVLGALEFGECICEKIKRQSLLHKDSVLGTALIDMYAKCGAMEKAQDVFQQLQLKDVVSWNTLIAGFSQLGQPGILFDLYNRMKAEGVVPNSISFIVLLNGCSHVGLLKEGEMLFSEMRLVYCLTPLPEHYTCMIDLFGRAGNIDKVGAFLKQVPGSGYHHSLLQSVMSFCRKWRNVRLGRWAFQQLMQLDKRCAAAYVSMGDIYASSAMQMETDREWML